MGQKVHSVGLRLGINRSFDSLWYDQCYQQSLKKEQIIRKAINSFLSIIPFLHLGRVFFQKSSQKTLITLFLYRREKKKKIKTRSRFFFRTSRVQRKGSHLTPLKNFNLSINSLYLLNNNLISYDSTLLNNSILPIEETKSIDSLTNDKTYDEIRDFLGSEYLLERKLSRKIALYHFPFLWDFKLTTKTNSLENYKLREFFGSKNQAKYLLTSKNILSYNNCNYIDYQNVKIQTVFELNSLFKSYQSFFKNSAELEKTQNEKQKSLKTKQRKNPWQLRQFVKPFQKKGKMGPQLNKKEYSQLTQIKDQVKIPNQLQRDIQNKQSTEALKTVALSPDFRKKHQLFLRLEESLSLLAKENIHIKPITTTQLTHSALFLAQEIAYVIEKAKKKKTPKKLIKKLIRKLSKRCLGVRIICSGRLGGVAMANKFAIKKGRTSLNMFSQKVDFAKTTALTKYGIIGIKVWISFKELSKRQIQSKLKINTIKKKNLKLKVKSAIIASQKSHRRSTKEKAKAKVS